jgi:hypothetical protein
MEGRLFTVKDFHPLCGPPLATEPAFAQLAE